MAAVTSKGGSGLSAAELGSFLFIAVVAVWFNFELIFSAQVPFFRDLGPIFYPMRFSLARSFQQGEIPLWDRHLAMGFPLLANFQSGVFYPPHLAFLALPFFAAVRALFVLHYLVAALGVYCLCRRWGHCSYLALVGALLFAFGGYTVSLSSMLSYFQTAVWLPWALIAWERFVESRSAKNFLLLNLTLLVQLLAGAPEIYAMSQGLLLLDGVRLRLQAGGPSFFRMVCLLLLANLTVLALAMVQILPTAELFLESRALQPLSYQQSTGFSFQPLSLLNLFFLDKQVDSLAVSGLKLFFSAEVPLIVSLYMGAIALPGLALWFIYSSLKEKIALFALLTAVLIVALGDRTPVYPFLFDRVAVFRFVRYPEKLFFFNYALLLYLVLSGLRRALESGRPFSRAPYFLLGSIWAALFFLYLFLRFDTAPLIRFVAETTRVPPFSIPSLDRAYTMLVHIEIFLVLGLGAIVVLRLCQRGAGSEGFFKSLLVLLVAADLVSAHRPYRYPLEPDFVYDGAKILNPSGAGLHRLFHYPEGAGLHPARYSFVEQKPSFASSQAWSFANLLPATGVLYGFDYLQDLDSLKRWPYVLFLAFAERLSAEEQYRLLGALNVKHLTSFRPLPGEGITPVRRSAEHGSWLYEVKRVVPRAYLVPGGLAEKEPEKILARLSRSDFDPRKEVLLEESVPVSAQGDFAGRAAIVDYGSRHVSIKAALNTSGILVLADSFYPGWKVFVDGKEQAVLRANLFFRAVALSAGDHLVEFRYEPRSFTIGLLISLTTLCGILGWFLVRLLFRHH